MRSGGGFRVLASMMAMAIAASTKGFMGGIGPATAAEEAGTGTFPRNKPRQLPRGTRIRRGKMWRRSNPKGPYSREGEALRRRMGGNARRIEEARHGRIWDDGAGCYKPCASVLYEEVDERRHMVHYIGDGGLFTTCIRGMWVKIFHPEYLGPTRYEEFEV